MQYQRCIFSQNRMRRLHQWRIVRSIGHQIQGQCRHQCKSFWKFECHPELKPVFVHGYGKRYFNPCSLEHSHIGNDCCHRIGYSRLRALFVDTGLASNDGMAEISVNRCLCANDCHLRRLHTRTIEGKQRKNNRNKTVQADRNTDMRNQGDETYRKIRHIRFHKDVRKRRPVRIFRQVQMYCIGSLYHVCDGFE